jgi:mRNA-degrading endonuclease RelE of RelBE toxin-antitoxin system
MANQIIPTTLFESKYKRFRKKFPSLENELADLFEILEENPKIGQPLGAGLYKIRVANEDKGKGKSGGFRVITYLVNEIEDDTDIYIITIYDKSEDSTIKKPDLIKMVKHLID